MKKNDGYFLPGQGRSQKFFEGVRILFPIKISIKKGDHLAILLFLSMALVMGGLLLIFKFDGGFYGSFINLMIIYDAWTINSEY